MPKISTHRQSAHRSDRVALVAILFTALAASACGPGVVVETPVPVIVSEASTDILTRLNAIEDVTAHEIPNDLPDYRTFSIVIDQPQFHRFDSGVTLPQRMLLHHRDDTAPMILATTGYDLFGAPQTWADYRGEITGLTNGNQLIVEHRFFGESIAAPEYLDWTALTVEDSAGDSHRIRELLGTIYTGNWIGTGVSKGGMTAIFHHVYYPDDLDGIVPYVAPISFGVSDPRYVDWLANIGPADGGCGQQVRDIALALLERLDEVVPFAASFSPGAEGLRDEVVRASVAQNAFGFVWGFWQSYGSVEACAALPDPQGPAEDLAVFGAFSALTSLGLYENTLAPYGYQVAHELGSQGFDYGELTPYLTSVEWDALIPGPPLPWPQEPTFVSQTMIDVDSTLRLDAKNVLAIYGAWDPWTAGMITVDAANDSHVVVAPARGHAARIASLQGDDLDFALEQLAAMADVELDVSKLFDAAVLFNSAPPSALAAFAEVDPMTRSILNVEQKMRETQALRAFLAQP